MSEDGLLILFGVVLGVPTVIDGVIFLIDSIKHNKWLNEQGKWLDAVEKERVERDKRLDKDIKAREQKEQAHLQYVKDENEKAHIEHDEVINTLADVIHERKVKQGLYKDSNSK